MKPLILATLLGAGAANAAGDCARTDRELYVNGWPEVRTHERMGAVTPGAQIECKFFPDQQQRENLLARYERGDLDGVNYRLSYADGGALVQGRRASRWDPADAHNWRLNCSTDEQATYHCVLRKGLLRLEQDAAGRRRLTVGDHHRPGSEVLLRVDSHMGITALAASGFSPTQIERLLGQMRAGTKLNVGYHRSDLQNASEDTLSLYGFEPALALMQEVLRQLNATAQPRGD